MQENNALEEFDTLAAKLGDVRDGLGKIIYGQEDVLTQTLITLAAGGHGLLVGAPGLAKTLLVTTIAKVMGLDAKRVQFTPDLMPGDILGSEVLEESEDGKRAFRFVPGPIFCQLLMSDEINRASPRTQSALLQAMQEHFVTIAGERHNLPAPFHVLATQNPIEQEGTYPLPEAQLDRFLMQIDVPFPDQGSERKMVIETTMDKTAEASQVMEAGDLQKIQHVVRQMPIGDTIVDLIIKLVRAARPSEGASDDVASYVEWGPGPRASQALSLSVRALAMIEGRSAPSPDDVRTLAGPVLKHRMSLNFAARAEGLTIDRFIANLCEQNL